MSYVLSLQLLVDEYGCLRRENKAIPVHKLGVKHHKPPRPDVIIVNAQQLLYHVVWPCGEVCMCWRSNWKRGLHCVLLQRKYSFVTVTLKYRLRTMRGSSELVFAPLHSTWTSTALCHVVRQWRRTNITSVACHVFSARSAWGVGCQLRVGMMASSCTMKQISPSYCFLALRQRFWRHCSEETENRQLSSSFLWHCMDNPRAPRWLKLGTVYTPTNRGSHCASCYCLRRTQTFTSTCDVLTCRWCLGRQLTNRWWML